MSVAELLPTLKQLDRAETLSVMSFLVQKMAQEENLLLSVSEAAQYPLWSQYDARDTAEALWHFAQEEGKHGPA